MHVNSRLWVIMTVVTSGRPRVQMFPTTSPVPHIMSTTRSVKRLPDELQPHLSVAVHSLVQQSPNTIMLQLPHNARKRTHYTTSSITAIQKRNHFDVPCMLLTDQTFLVLHCFSSFAGDHTCCTYHCLAAMVTVVGYFNHSYILNEHSLTSTPSIVMRSDRAL